MPEPLDIPTTLRRIFNGLTEVRVITLVGEATVSISEVDSRTHSALTLSDESAAAIVTVFNLVDGDATNVIPPSLKDDPAMREFHSAQVERSLKTLPDNIAALIALGKTILDQ
jgi:hypothetical protein